MADSSLGTPEQLRDPNYTPPMGQAVPLGIQHVLAMFVSNVTPAIIIAFAAGYGFGSPDAFTLVYMIQMSMLFAGVATLIQTIGIGPIGARLPIVQGTSFAYLPVMIPAMAGAGVAGLGGLMTGVIVGGIFHFILGFFIKRIRFALPPLVTGLIVLMIGLALIKVGIQYAAGGVPAIGKPEFGSLLNWFVALVVIVVTLCIKFFVRGFMSVAAVLIGLVAGYIVAALFGMVSLDGVGRAGWFMVPSPFKWGLDWNWSIIIGMCLMAFISAIETVGDTSGITKGGAGREATDDEIQGATFADGIGTAIAGVFGGLPNTSFSQNVGLISMTGIMSRHVVTFGAIFLIICGFIPKIGAIIASVPIEVLGGGVIVMFGMVASAGVNMLSDVVWNRRNMIIFATALSIGLGLQLVPEALQHVGSTWKILLTSGLLPAAFIAIVLNLLLPEDLDGDEGGDGVGDGSQSGGGQNNLAHETQISGLGAASSSSTADSSAGSSPAPATAASLASTTTSAKSAASGAKSSRASKASTSSKAKSTSRTTKTAKTASAAKKSKTPAKAKKPAAKPKPAAKASAKTATKTATKTASKSASKSASKPASKSTAAKAGVSDDIELIDGVGPVLGKKLQKLGYGSLSKIASASLSDLTAAADNVSYAEKSEKYARDWQKQAKDLLAGKPARAKSDRARQKSGKK